MRKISRQVFTPLQFLSPSNEKPVQPETAAWYQPDVERNLICLFRKFFGFPVIEFLA